MKVHKRIGHLRGAASLESGLLIALIALGTAGAVVVSGDEVKELFSRTANAVEDSDGGPAISLAGASGIEGETLSFEISLSEPHRSDITVGFSVAEGSADEADYSPASGSVTIGAGSTSGSIAIATIDDPVHEVTETFQVALAGASFGRLVNSVGSGTIIDNEIYPVVSLAVSQTSGNEDSVDPTFTASIAPASSEEIVVGFETVDGSALAGRDYNAVSGNWIFAPGETSKSQVVNVLADSTVEPDRSFTFAISGSGGAESAGYTIMNDDATPLGYGSSHTEEGCVAVGGSVVNAGGQNVCRFNQASCKSGWSQYSQWSTTRSNLCYWKYRGTRGRDDTPYCNNQAFYSGSHSWSNKGVEQRWEYSSAWSPCSGPTRVYCTATRTQIGCI